MLRIDRFVDSHAEYGGTGLLRRSVGDLKLMTAADGGAGSGARPGRRWDVALSFAGAQRDYVGQVARALKARGVRCFYDADEQIGCGGSTWPRNCPASTRARRRQWWCSSRPTTPARDWTRLERRAAFSRAVLEAGVYVLPARFDDSELPGLLPDVGVIDLRGHTPEQFAAWSWLSLPTSVSARRRPSGERRRGAAGRGAGERGRPAAAGGACGDQRARGIGRGCAGVRTPGHRRRRARGSGEGDGRGAAGRVGAAGRRILRG